MPKAHRIEGDMHLLGLSYMGNAQSTGTTRTIQLVGTEANIHLDLTVKGTGLVRVPSGYEANINSDLALVNRGYTKTKLGNINLNALVQTPTAAEDGYRVAYNHATTSYTLQPVGDITFGDGLTKTGSVVKLGGNIDDAETNITQTAAGTLRVRSRFTSASDEAGLEVTAVANNNNQARLYAAGGSLLFTPTAATLTAPGAGALLYAANYAANFTSDRSIPDLGWIKSKIGGKAVDALIMAPTASENGYLISWDNPSGTYKLTAPQSVGDLFWKTNGDTTLQSTVSIIGTGGKNILFNLQQSDAAGLHQLEPDLVAFRVEDTPLTKTMAFQMDKNGGVDLRASATTTDIGILTVNTTDISLTFHTPNSTVKRVVLHHQKTGAAPVAGIGAGFEFKTETAANTGAEVTGGYLDFVSTDLTAASENFKFSLSLNHDAAIAEKFSITSAGLIKGIFTQDEALTKILAVNASGEIYWRNSQPFTDPFAVIEDEPGAAYTFQATDHYKIKRFTNTSPITATLPASAFSTGWIITVYRALGAGVVTFATAVGATLESTGTTLDTQKTSATIFHRGSNNYVAVGALGEAAGGGGFLNSAAANELIKSDAVNGVPSGLFSSSAGNITMGSASLTGSRTISAVNSTALADLNLLAEAAVNITAPSGVLVTMNAATTNTVDGILTLRRTSSGTPATGIGAMISFQVETAADNIETGVRIEAVTTDVTAASEDFDLVFKNMAGGAAAAERFRITSDGRIYGTALHNNAGSLTGTANQYIASGTYTPTSINNSQVSSATIHPARWVRVGNVVYVDGRLEVTPVSNADGLSLLLSLPITSAISGLNDLNGGAWFALGTGTTSFIPTAVDANAANDRADVKILSGATARLPVATHMVHYHYSYEML